MQVCKGELTIIFSFEASLSELNPLVGKDRSET